MLPPDWTDVPAQLRTWADTVVAAGTAITSGQLPSREIPLCLAEFHGRFERIHPFIDGNGRTGRLLLNLTLVRLGFPPAIIFKRSRDCYLAALGSRST